MRSRVLALEAVGIAAESGIESGLAGDEHGVGMPVVDAVRGHVGDAGVTVGGVVPGEECLAVGSRILDAAEARREVGAVLHGLELRFGEWVVVRDVGPAVALDDIEIDQKGGHGLGAHAGTAIGMQGELAGFDVMPGDCFGNKLLSQFGAFAWRDHPADDMAAEDVEDHVEMEGGPLRTASTINESHLVCGRCGFVTRA